nr:hypothetical protein [uncultured Dyadobacter sp.]
MTSFSFRKWLPGILFLSAQLVNTIYELTQDTRTMSWAPHTTQVHYRIDVFQNGENWGREAVEARYRIAQTQWESHSEGNLRRLIQSVEQKMPDHPDSVIVRYQRNNGPERLYRWKASL